MLSIACLTNCKTIRRVMIAAGAGLVMIGLLIVGMSSGLTDWVLALVAVWQGEPPAPHWLAKIHAIGVEAFVCGLAVIALGWFSLPRWRRIVAYASKSNVVFAVSVLVVVGLWLPVALIGHSAVIGGERYWWLDDDAMISMRYARHLAQGLGLVWNPGGERVEGYTNLLWTLYMALVHLLPIPVAQTSLIILLTNIALAVATIPVIIRFVRALGGSPLVVAATVLGFVLNKNVMAWTTAGFETALLTLLFLLGIYRIIAEAQQCTPRLLTFMIIALLSLVRSDAVILSVLLYALAVWLHRNRTLIIGYAALSLALPIAHTLYRATYYGDVLPNTAYLKVFGWEGALQAGFRYFAAFAMHYPFALGFALFGSLLTKDKVRRALLAVVLVYIGYVIYVGGDVFPNFRFFIPILPLILALAFLGVQSLIRTGWTTPVQGEQLSAPRTILLAIGLSVMISGVTMAALAPMIDLLVTGAQSGVAINRWFAFISGVSALAGGVAVFFGRNALQRLLLQPAISFKVWFGLLCLVGTPLLVPGYSWFLLPNVVDVGNVTIGLLLKHNTPPTSKVADFWAGSVFYFSERYAIDLLGKSDRHVARLPAASSGTMPGHNKFDFDYSLGVLKPDFVVANFALPVEEAIMRQAATGDFAFTGQLYFHRLFQRHCLPYPIPIETWRTIFVCDWSEYIGKRHDWNACSIIVSVNCATNR